MFTAANYVGKIRCRNASYFVLLSPILSLLIINKECRGLDGKEVDEILFTTSIDRLYF